MVVKHQYLVMYLFTVGFIVYLLSASPAILTFNKLHNSKLYLNNVYIKFDMDKNQSMYMLM